MFDRDTCIEGQKRQKQRKRMKNHNSQYYDSREITYKRELQKWRRKAEENLFLLFHLFPFLFLCIVAKKKKNLIFKNKREERRQDVFFVIPVCSLNGSFDWAFS